MQAKKRRQPTPKSASLAIVATPAQQLAKRAELVDAAHSFADRARADRTKAAYASEWRTFETWCAEHLLCALPCSPVTLVLFLTSRAQSGIRPSSLSVSLAAIGARHAEAGEIAPTTKHPHVAKVWRGIRRSLGTAPDRAAPVPIDDLRAMSEALDEETLIGLRDRALLVVGFAGAFRRSELVALNVADLRFARDGLHIHVRHSKTDQEGAGAEVGLPYGAVESTCPVRTLRAWLDAIGILEGAVFPSVSRHGKLGQRLLGGDVARIVQRTAAVAGLDPTLYSGHSLRSGLATAAAKAGKKDRRIMAQGRWKSRATVDRYVRDAKLLDSENAASGIGL